MLKKELKRSFLLFFILFVLLFGLINFYNFSKKLNYRFKKAIQTSEEIAMIEEITSSASAEEKKEKEIVKPDTLEIPKLYVEAPILRAETKEISELKDLLDRGVVLYPDSVNPGEKGQIFILGHSAPPGWPQIKYDWVFSRVGELNSGDEIKITFKNKDYTYLVKRKIFLEKGETIPQSSGEDSVLYLITCWPPGKDFKRLAVEAFLKKE